MAGPENLRPGIFPISSPPREAPVPVLPKPDVRTAPEDLPQPKRKKEKKGISTKARIALAGLAALGAVETTGAVITEQTNNQPVSAHTIPADLAWPWNLGRSAAEDIRGFLNKNRTPLYEGSLAPKESVSWWQELSTEQIQKLAEIPSINIIEKDISKINPVLQQKAKEAGYELIYQGDPNDTTGRTILAKGRESSNNDWTMEDQGFGRAGGIVRGIFKAWVPDPEDPTQKDHIYAFVVDPVSKKETLVRLGLQQDNPNSDISRTAWFAVDDLYNGPSEIKRRSKEVGRQPGQELSTDDLPSPSDPPLKQAKKLTDSPTFNDLLRKQALSLTDLAMPGDYVKIVMQTAGVDEVKGDYRYKTDENGISRAMILVIRRFGGKPQWKSEISASAK